MNDDGAKLWLQNSLNQVAIRRATDAIRRLGMALPCRVVAVSGSIVTVSFEVTSTLTLPEITIPKAEGQWVRSPTQVGDLGMTVAADAYLGGVSGLGGGTADMTRPANLSALVWVPVAAKGFPAAPNLDAVYVNGPAGVVAQDTGGTNVLTLDDAGTLTITSKTKIVLNAPVIQLNGEIAQGGYNGGSGTVTIQGPVTVVNDLTANGISLDSHVHGGVQSGGSDTTGPIG